MIPTDSPIQMVSPFINEYSQMVSPFINEYSQMVSPFIDEYLQMVSPFINEYLYTQMVSHLTNTTYSYGVPKIPTYKL